MFDQHLTHDEQRRLPPLLKQPEKAYRLLTHGAAASAQVSATAVAGYSATYEAKYNYLNYPRSLIEHFGSYEDFLSGPAVVIHESVHLAQDADGVPSTRHQREAEAYVVEQFYTMLRSGKESVRADHATYDTPPKYVTHKTARTVNGLREFGINWWEMVPPTATNFRKLAFQIAERIYDAAKRGEVVQPPDLRGVEDAAALQLASTDLETILGKTNFLATNLALSASTIQGKKITFRVIFPWRVQGEGGTIRYHFSVRSFDLPKETLEWSQAITAAAKELLEQPGYATHPEFEQRQREIKEQALTMMCYMHQADGGFRAADFFRATVIPLYLLRHTRMPRKAEEIGVPVR